MSPSPTEGFSAVPPSQTGIHFTNRLPPSLATQNQNLMNGSGVAAGDFDGDGRCDLYFCAINGTNTLYRNLGNWRFEEVARTAGVTGRNWASTGAVFADLDGDGDNDLLVSTLGAGVQGFRNLGQGRFELATTESGLASTSGATSLALGDVDGDGDLDLYAVNYGAESVLRSGGRAEIKKVNGEWVFTGPNAHRLRYRDGQVEEVGEAGFLYLNDGKGRFKALPWSSQYFTGIDGLPKPPPLDYGLGAQMRDVNGDGAPDLYICNDFQMPDRLWINDGRGRFREAPFQALRKFPFSSMGVDFGDLDRDGHLDFFAVEMASREQARAQRQVSGLTPSPNIPGRFDARPQVGRNTLFRSNGDGSWSEIAEFSGLAATDWSWQPVFLDVDLDGFEDVLVANGMMFDTQDRDTLARIQSFGRQAPTNARTNLLLYPPFNSPNVAFRNLGAFQFQDASTRWHFDSPSVSQGVALADLDDDGDADVIINCLNDPPLLYRNEGSAPRLAVRLRGTAPNTFGIGAQIRVEGGPVPQFQEMIAGGRYLSGDDPFRSFACGTATQLTVRVTWRSGRTTVVTNAAPNTLLTLSENPEAPVEPRPSTQPKPDLPRFVDASPTLRHQHHEVLFDDFARQPLLHRQLSALGPGLAWTDLDLDGRDELVIGTGRGGKLGARRFSTDGTASDIPTDWIAPGDVTGITGWRTREGRPALLAAVSAYEESSPRNGELVEVTLDPAGQRLQVSPALQFNPGTGTTTIPAYPGPLAAADFDGDGDLDLFIGSRVIPGSYPRATPSLLLRRDNNSNNTTTTWTPDPKAAALLERAGMVSAAVWSDLENDGFPELILACEWGPLRILRNQQGKFTNWNPQIAPELPGAAPRLLSELTGWWNVITAGDFNNDGRLDLVAANWGLNTGYRATPLQPLRIHFARLSSPTGEDLIESYFAADSGKEVPRRSLNALGRAFPFLAGRFPTHRAYGNAGIQDILSALPFPPATVAATTLASTLFLNTPTGWTAVPLPAEAQYAPAFGISVMDLDSDGDLDLFLAQNFFGTRIEWPRCDAGRGLFLSNDGTGRFVPLTSSESGLVILGEQRGAAVADFNNDGKPDLAVAQNGAPTTLWKHSTDQPQLRIRLTGPAGNPDGFGTTLRPRFGTNDGPIHEIRASTGYWSKDSATLFLPGTPRPTELLVRWPGGQLQTVAVPPTGDPIVIASPNPNPAERQ
ncbi:MAG: VCBS repeat-containing protein [Limisphaerales bacterium]